MYRPFAASGLLVRWGAAGGASPATVNAVACAATAALETPVVGGPATLYAPGFSKVQTGVEHTAVATNVNAVSLGSNPTEGNLICVGVIFAGSNVPTSISSIVDANGNVYTLSASSPKVSDGGSQQLWLAYLIAPANAHKTVTVTFAANFSSCALWIDEFAGSPTILFDSDASGTGTGTTINTPTVPVTSEDLLYAVAVSGTISSVNNPWTANDGGIIAAQAVALYDVRASTNTAFDLTGSGDWTGLGMSFKSRMALAEMQAPAITGAAVVLAVECAATAALLVPSLGIPETVSAVACAATAAMPNPEITGAVSIAAASCDATAAMPAPLAGEAVAVLAVSCDATADAIAPTLSFPFIVLAVPCSATAAFAIPVISNGVTNHPNPVRPYSRSGQPDPFPGSTGAGQPDPFRDASTPGQPNPIRPLP